MALGLVQPILGLVPRSRCPHTSVVLAKALGLVSHILGLMPRSMHMPSRISCFDHGTGTGAEVNVPSHTLRFDHGTGAGAPCTRTGAPSTWTGF